MSGSSSVSCSPALIHPNASYVTTIFSELSTKSDVALDTRDGIGWISSGLGTGLRVTCDSNCNYCQYRYDPSSNPTGHIVPYRLFGESSIAVSNTMTRSLLRKFHKLLFELYYAGARGLPGQFADTVLSWGAVTKYNCYIVGLGGESDSLVLRVDNGLDPRTVPFKPNDVGFFKGGTNYDYRIMPIIEDVDYSGTSSPLYEFTVRLSWDVDNVLTGTGIPYCSGSSSASAAAIDARFVICTYQRPQYTTFYAHEKIACRKKTWIIESTDPEWPADAAPGYGAITLKDFDGNNCRIARPVSENEIRPGESGASSAFGTFKVETYSGGSWADVTSTIRATETDPLTGLVVKHHWRRVQVSHTSAGNDFSTKLYMRSYVPNTAGSGWYSYPQTDLLSGKTKLRITYWPEATNDNTSRRWLTSMLCTNAKRDYSQWIGTCGYAPNGVGVDSDSRHWFCNARSSASGVANFVPGKCCLNRKCDSYDWGYPDPPTPESLGEIETAKWITESQIVAGIAHPNNLIYHWGIGPSLYLLAGHYYDTPNQYHPARETQGNGSIGYWLYGDLTAGCTVNAYKGAIYRMTENLNGAGETVYVNAGESSAELGLFVLYSVTDTATYRSNKRAEYGDETTTSDPKYAHRINLLRKIVSTTLYPVEITSQWFRRARAANSNVEGENRIQRVIRQDAKTNIYFPNVDCNTTGTYSFETGTVTIGSWTIGGVEYSIRITKNRLGKDYGVKRLGGTSPNRYGEDSNNRGRIYSTSYDTTNRQLVVHCYPGVRLIAQTGSSGNPDVVIPYFAGGNVTELPDYLRPRSRYEFYTYNKFGDVLDKAYSGDTWWLVSDTTHKFYIRGAIPCNTQSFTVQTSNYTLAYGWPTSDQTNAGVILGPLFDGLEILEAESATNPDVQDIDITGVYYWHVSANYNGTIFSKTTAATEEAISYGGARSRGSGYYYWRDSTKSALFTTADIDSAYTDYMNNGFDRNYTKVRVYYKTYDPVSGWGSEQNKDLYLWDEVSSGILRHATSVKLDYPPDTVQANIGSDEVYDVDPFDDDETEITQQDSSPVTVEIDEYPSSGEYAFSDTTQIGSSSVSVSYSTSASPQAEHYVHFHPNMSGQRVDVYYKTAAAVSSGNPPALPTGVTGFPCTDNSYLLQLDTLYIYDEHDYLKALYDADPNHFDDLEFQVASDGVFQIYSYASSSTNRPDVYYMEKNATPQSWNQVDVADMLIWNADGTIYIKKAVPDEHYTGTPWCFKISCRLTAGL